MMMLATPWMVACVTAEAVDVDEEGADTAVHEIVAANAISANAIPSNADLAPSTAAPLSVLTSYENDNFADWEGDFFGDVFATPQVLKACHGTYGLYRSCGSFDGVGCAIQDAGPSTGSCGGNCWSG